MDDREYDIFEIFPDGSAEWHACVAGLDRACAKLQELSGGSANEFFAIHTPSRQIVARANVRLKAKQRKRN